jgi:HlyD family secretion protein
MKRLLWLVAIIAWGCFSGYESGSRPELIVHRGLFVREMVLSGSLTAAAGAAISVPHLPSWQTSIKWIVADGTEVKDGDRVVELDNGPFTSDLDAKRQAVVQAGQQLAQKDAEWAADLAQKELDVDRKGIDSDKANLEANVPREILSGRDYEDKQIKRKRADVELAKARDVLRSQREQVGADRANLALTLGKAQRLLQEAEKAINDLTLRAPRAGIAVVRDHPWEGRKLQAGDTVWVGLRLALIPEPSSLEVDAALADVDDRRVAIGMPATVILDAFPALRFAGRVTGISPVAAESARASMRRAFTVVVKLDHIDQALMRPGLSAQVIVRTGQRANALLAARAALDLNASHVKARLSDGRLMDIAVGPCNAEECVVEKGLREGEVLAPFREKHD